MGGFLFIDDGETTIWESHSIVRYLSAHYGAGAFWGGHLRTLIRRALDGLFHGGANEGPVPFFFRRSVKSHKNIDEGGCKIANDHFQPGCDIAQPGRFFLLLNTFY
jgi:hypothetical protein